eukprot:CAMPEP_0194356204 /NCGR_PEP_ID=MMETSP0174-20130528/3935_1 /TAXON_ID=216777 /ORGANISM="Proboscia alata, Strain PI-D3" /LENGTH=607 /DNA_ID=CAMNT_0039125725 /DNA_START=129 /DNA_END=1949 /DNA_ORIENTATION=-
MVIFKKSCLVVAAASCAVVNLSVLKGVNAELADYDLLGSCTYTSPWTGPTCIEFRGEGWESATMTDRCAKETDSTLVVVEGGGGEAGCTIPPELAGWCVLTIVPTAEDETSSSTMLEASPMMISAMAECSGNEMTCETFVGGTWEAATNCEKSNIMIESFDDPKFMWESFTMDDAKMGDMNAMQNQYGFDISGYNNGNINSTATTTGSSMDIVDGIMILTANITGDGVGNMVTMIAGGKFPDLSTCDGLQLEAMATRPGGVDTTMEGKEYDYDGYMIDFGNKKLPGNVFEYGYRANIVVPISNSDAAAIDANESSSDTSSVVSSTTRQQDNNGQQQPFLTVNIPFNEFSLDYDFITGKQTTSCMEDATLCPDEITLRNLETMTITAIGKTNGVVQLHIKSIHGTGCDAVDTNDMDDSQEKNNNEHRVDQLTCSSSSDSATPDEIILESFSNPSYDWGTQNDPVMGGESYSSMEMTESDGTAYFTGEVKNVPFLGVPGYIKTQSAGMAPYPDVSCCDSLKLTVMGMEEYGGYRVSFGTKRAKTGFFATGFKGNFDAPIGEYGDVVIPFNMFSVEWDEATGDQKITCAKDPDVCPDMETLQDMELIAIW